jgi:hypothetical protein
MPDKERGRPDGAAPIQDPAQVYDNRSTPYPAGVWNEAPAVEVAPKPDQVDDDQAPALSPERRADLHHSGITDEIIDGPLRIADAPDDDGWTVTWSDLQEIPTGKYRGTPGFELVIYDRDKRPDDGRKTAWPKGTTPFPAIFRWVPAEDATGNVYVEGQRQALAVASYAPDGARVWCLPGIELSAKILDRLAEHAAGLPAIVVPDGDWRRNDQVGRAVTERLPELLTQAGAAGVLVADVGGIGREGIDDILGDTLPERRADKLASTTWRPACRVVCSSSSAVGSRGAWPHSHRPCRWWSRCRASITSDTVVS